MNDKICKVLDRSAEMVKENWCANGWGWEGRRCVVHAIRDASKEVNGLSTDLEAVVVPEVLATVRETSLGGSLPDRVLGVREENVKLGIWNDRKETTKEDVIEAITLTKKRLCP